MSMSCPHCGASLPAVGDAFCPECHEALDEPPTAPRASGPAQPAQAGVATPVVRYLGWFFLVAGLVGGVKPSKMWGLVEAAVEVAFVVVGAGLVGASYWMARRRPEPPSRLSERSGTTGPGGGA
jgi:hypothetical protein